MAKKIQKKQIEDGVFVETKSTYTPPTQDSEYIQKKYVDEEVAKKANVSHTHSWYDITDKPGVTNIPSVYTTEFRIGDMGSVIVPKLPYWVGENKPTYNWGDILNKPEIDVELKYKRLPEITGKITDLLKDKGGVFRVGDSARLQGMPDGEWYHFFGGRHNNNSEQRNFYFALHSHSIDNYFWVGRQNNTEKVEWFKFIGITALNDNGLFREWNLPHGLSTYIGDSDAYAVRTKFSGQGGDLLFSLNNEKAYFSKYLDTPEIRINTEGNSNITRIRTNNEDLIIGNVGWNDLRYLKTKGIKIWGHESNDKVVLAGGGVTHIDNLKNENVKVGGRNLIKDSNSFNVRSWNYNKGTHKGSTFVTPRGSQYANEATKLTFSGQEWDIFQKINFDESGSYVLSGWVKLETANNLLIVVNNSYAATAIFGKAVITGEGWQKFSVPLNVSGNLQQTFGHIHLGGYATIPTGETQSAGDVLLWNLKLEKGNKVTDWSPAPEDFDFFKGNIQLSDLNTFKNRETGAFFVNIGGGSGAYLNFKLEGSTSSLEFFKRNWYATTRIGVRNSVDSARFNNDGGAFRDLAWYEDVYRVGAAISSNWTATVEHQNNTIFVENSLNIELGQLQNMGSISFIKTFDGGNVTFTCAGKTIKYPFDNQFNGKDGSTAVATVYGNKCYIRISNV